MNNRSPNESYLPNNVLDAQDNGFDRCRVNPIPGRWGEPGGVPADTRGRDYLGQVIVDTTGTPVPGIYNNPVGPGRSIYLTRVDGFDDDYNGIDFYPLPPSAAEETANFVDPAGALALPSERYRYAVTPFDLFGIGRVINYNGIKINGDADHARLATTRSTSPSSSRLLPVRLRTRHHGAASPTSTTSARLALLPRYRKRARPPSHYPRWRDQLSRPPPATT